MGAPAPSNPQTELPVDLDAAAAGTPLRPYLAHLLEGSARHRKFVVASAHDLFSSASIDFGTRRLLRALGQAESPMVAAAQASLVTAPLRVLDVGCGCGTIGIGLARGFGPSVDVTMIDRDRLAVEVARMNLRGNHLGDAPSDAAGAARVLDARFGYAAVDADERARSAAFDWIISNVPAKVGDGGLQELLLGAGPRLARGGSVAFVHVTPLTPNIDGLQNAYEAAHGATHPLVVVAVDAAAEHTVRLWQFPNGLPLSPPSPSPDDQSRLAPWRRADASDTFELDSDRPRVPHLAVHDLPEFDTLDRRTRMVVQVLKVGLPRPKGSPPERVLVLSPRHGALPLLLAISRRIAALGMTSRDTLELDVADLNVRAGMAAWDVAVDLVPVTPRDCQPWLPAPGGSWDLIAGCPRWREGPRALAHQLATMRDALSPIGAFALGIESGDLQGVRDAARQAGLRVGRELKRKGFAGVILRPKA